MPRHSKFGNTKINRFINVRKGRQVNNIRKMNNIPDNNLIIIKGCLENGKSLRILVDNASQAELISESAAIELNKKNRKVQYEVRNSSRSKHGN